MIVRILFLLIVCFVGALCREVRRRNPPYDAACTAHNIGVGTYTRWVGACALWAYANALWVGADAH